MTIQEMFEIKEKMPELSGDAFLLLIFIAWRTEGTTFKDRHGRYIFMTGANNPVKAFNWYERKYTRLRYELKEHKLIDIVKQGVGKPAKVYLTIEKYRSVRTNMSGQKCQDINDSHNRIDLSVITGQKCPSKQDKNVRRFIYKDDTERDRERDIERKKAAHAAAPRRLSRQEQQIAELERLIAIETEKERKAKHDKE